MTTKTNGNVITISNRKYTSAHFDGFGFWLDRRSYSESTTYNYCRIIANVCNELKVEPDKLTDEIAADYIDKQLRHKASVVKLYLTYAQINQRSARSVYVGAINEQIIASFQHWHDTQPRNGYDTERIDQFCSELKNVCARHGLNLRGVEVAPELIPDFGDITDLFNAFRTDVLQYAAAAEGSC